MNDILQYQQMLGQNTSMYDSALSIAEQENAAKEEPIETGEVGSGMIGIKMGVDKTIEAIKNKIKGKLTEKAEELKDNIKSKLQEKADELKGKFEDLKQKVTPQQEEEPEGPIIEEPDDQPPPPQEEGPLIEEVSHETVQPSQESEPVIEEPQPPEPTIQEPVETPQQTSFIRRYPTAEDMEAIKNQAIEDTKQFRSNLVPNENVEQDHFDMRAQKLTDANRSAKADIENPDTQQWRARLQQKMIDRNNDEIEKIRQQKMDETGEDLNIRTPPTDDEYSQIHQYFEKRLEDLTNEKMNELNPPREQPTTEAPQVEETAVPEIQETSQAIVPVTRGAVEDETQALVPQTQEIQTAGDNIAKSLVKTTGEAIGEEAAEESGLAEASSALDLDPLTAPLGIILGLGSVLFGIYHKPKVHNLPKVINTATEFGA